MHHVSVHGQYDGSMYLVLVTDVNGKWWRSRMCIMSPSTVSEYDDVFGSGN